MPSSGEAPPEVSKLAARRGEARAARDFVEADRLRDALAGAGWAITDTPDGFELTRAAPAAETFPDYRSVPSLLHEPPLARHGVCVAYYGWPEDLERLLDGVFRTAQGQSGAVEMVIAVAGGAEPPPRSLAEVAHPALARPPVVTRVNAPLGHAEALNVAARRARSEFVHFTEPSLLLTWDVLEQAAEVLADPAVGACGPFGLATDDWREFHPAETADALALEYLVSVRRSDIPAIGEMDTAFRFYRNLDIAYSRQVVAAGFALRRYDAHVERGIHRLWEATAPADRDRLSRRNFNRLLDRWVRPGAPGS
jgi:hypothetical protein